VKSFAHAAMSRTQITPTKDTFTIELHDRDRFAKASSSFQPSTGVQHAPENHARKKKKRFLRKETTQN